MFDKERVTIIECEIVWMKIGVPDFNERLLFTQVVFVVVDLLATEHVREYDWQLNFIKSDKIGED